MSAPKLALNCGFRKFRCLALDQTYSYAMENVRNDLGQEPQEWIQQSGKENFARIQFQCDQSIWAGFSYIISTYCASSCHMPKRKRSIEVKMVSAAKVKLVICVRSVGDVCLFATQLYRTMLVSSSIHSMVWRTAKSIAVRPMRNRCVNFRSDCRKAEGILYCLDVFFFFW